MKCSDKVNPWELEIDWWLLGGGSRERLPDDASFLSFIGGVLKFDCGESCRAL